MPKFGQADTGRFFQLHQTLPDEEPTPEDRALEPIDPDAEESASDLSPDGPVEPPAGGRRLTALLERSERLLKPTDAADLSQLAAEMHELLLQSLDLEKLRTTESGEAEDSVREALRELVASQPAKVPPEQRDALIEMVVDEVLGFGPIDPLLEDPSVQEIMVNAPDIVYVESNGVLTPDRSRSREAM